MTIPRSKELEELYYQTEDIASQLQQEPNSAHLLLSFFLLPNKAEQLLRERHVDEDRILAEITGQEEEAPGILEQIAQRSQQIAMSCGSDQLDSLHLLVALSRTQGSLAYQLLQRCEVSLSTLRNQAMSYLSGRVRRRFDSSYNPDEVEVVPAGHSAPSNSKRAGGVSEEGLDDKAIASLRRGELNAESFPWLHSLARNLTQLAHDGKIDPLIGREKELNEIIDILGKRRANNPCLIGEPGVGKTALVEGLALRMATQNLPGLSDKLIVELDMGSLLAGTQLRGSLAEKLQGIKDEVKAAAGQIIVFIDEIHTLVRAGATGESAQDASNDLKRALSRGDFPCIGATTIHDYRMYVETDLALVRRFHTIHIEEPTEQETLQILDGVVPNYALHHQVHYLPEALVAASRLSARYLHDRKLPAKAIDILDLAGSRARRNGINTIGRPEVARVIAKLASIPEEHLLVEDRQRLLRMEHNLAEQIVGHRENLTEIAAVIRRNYAGFCGQRPIGSFLFLGPTGVGKTETAKAIANLLFHKTQSLIRIDMSEYQDIASVNRLIGAPPGYVGHDEGGQLTEAVRTKPYQLVLLDEIDKAHRDVLLLLLQLLDEGHLTDGKGRRISFSNCVVVMTSNLGSECFEHSGRTAIGFSKGAPSETELRDTVLQAASKQLPIELWNRIDARIVFMPLKRAEIHELARLMIERSSQQLLQEKNITYSASEAVIDWLIQHGGYHPQLGARPMRTMIRRHLEARLAELILLEQLTPGDRLEAVLDPQNTIGFHSLQNHHTVTPPDHTKHMPPKPLTPPPEDTTWTQDDLLALPL